ncbi:MAG: hypothetical protein ACFWTZ_04165 [Burkholderia sp.]|jgi:predicted small secreted protein
MKKMFFAAMLAASAIALSGCNTVNGLGQDLQTGAHKTSQAIDRATHSSSSSSSQKSTTNRSETTATEDK